MLRATDMISAETNQLSKAWPSVPWSDRPIPHLKLQQEEKQKVEGSHTRKDRQQ